MSFNARFNYTMTPNLSLQVYAEPFVSAGKYTNFKELVDGRAANYADRYRPLSYAGNFRFGRDFSGVFAAPSHNVFLVKFSYWLNM